MRFYLAARYSRLDEMNQYAEQLRKLGHIVDARWLLGNHQMHDNPEAIDNPNNIEVPSEGKLFAQDDFDDLVASDIIICFTEKPHGQVPSRGGRHVELGLALMWNYLIVKLSELSNIHFGDYYSIYTKDLFIVGPRENVFCCMDGIKLFLSWDRCYKYLIKNKNIYA